jgi:hypothetical protein
MAGLDGGEGGAQLVGKWGGLLGCGRGQNKGVVWASW